MNSQITNPFLLIGEASSLEKISQMILASLGAFESDMINQTADYGEALDIVKRSVELHATVIVLDDVSPACIKLIEELKSSGKTPVVVMTDSDEVEASMHANGVNFILPLGDVSTRQFSSIISAARAHFDLEKSHKKLENSQAAADKRFQDVADHFSDWLWEIDSDLNIVFSSSRKRPAQNAKAGEVFFNCFLPEETSRISDDFQSLKEKPQPFRDREYWSMDAFGTRLCWSLSGVPVTNTNGELVGFRGVGQDVSAKKASTDQLYYLSNHDSLTSLYNRSRFVDEMGRSLRHAQRDNGQCMIMLLSIDRFRYVNETYGHEVGDRLLVHVSQILKDQMRSSDIVGRTGADEFAMLLPDVQLSEVEFRANMVMDAISRRPMMTDRGMVTFGVSMGVSQFPGNGHDVDELLSKAGMAQRSAKQLGRNRVEVFNDKNASHREAADSLEWRDFVSKCLQEEHDRLVLYFQPIIRLSDAKKRDFYEVLVRLLDQDGQIVPPVKFIETAERFGLISRLDEIVATRAIDTLRNWHARGRKLKFTVNLSGKTFDDNKALDNIEKALEEADLPPGSVVFEITETAALRDLSQVKSVIERFRKHGASFAMDDCGSGYSSLSYIRDLDLDIIKIDGAFVRNMDKSDVDCAFVKALHEMASHIEILTVAEMVETEETLERLKAMDVDYAQGYYFAVPSPNILDDVE